jgi:hypothetical protein
MNKLITILIIAIALIVFVKIFDIGIRRHEKAECLQWQNQSQQYEGWYSADWQKEQCNQFGINL